MHAYTICLLTEWDLMPGVDEDAVHLILREEVS